MTTLNILVFSFCTAGIGGEGRTGHACHLTGMLCLTCQDVLVAVLVLVGFSNDAGKAAYPLLHGLVEQT